MGTTYREKRASWVNSPILGRSFDGYPIYGPYGYSDPTNAASSIRRIRSGFRVRSIRDLRECIPGKRTGRQLKIVG
ncbi:MAG: YHYH protein [Blastocatellia bacterium]